MSMNDAEPGSMLQQYQQKDVSIESPKVNIEVFLKDVRWRRESMIESRIRQSAKVARSYLGDLLECEEINFVLTSDSDIQWYNLTYRGKNMPTNVLSFPVGDFPTEDHAGPVPKGDILLAFETVEREARELDISVDDHVVHLVVHGVLHLFGFDHLTDDETERMEALEVRILDELGVADPYATGPE